MEKVDSERKELQTKLENLIHEKGITSLSSEEMEQIREHFLSENESLKEEYQVCCVLNAE